MANEEHLAILRQGVEAWNRWRAENPDVRPDLSNTNLEAMDLTGAVLSNVLFQNASLRAATLSNANLRGASLRDANCRGTVLRDANLFAASLCKANLSQANLVHSDLSRADLTYADFSGAWTSSTIFGNVDLSVVKGLEKVHHLGPSFVDISTLYRSGGKIPESFLRGCGVPESLIEYLPALIGAMEPIQFYSCFISHSTKDQDFAHRLYERMQRHRLRVWYAPEELKAGQKLDEEIEEAIRVYDKLIIVLSEASLHSKWVIKEIRKARKVELANNRRKFFPIRLLDMKVVDDWECYDPESGQDLAAEVREYFIPDFSHWKDHDAFEAAFAKLLEALKATEEPPVPRDMSVVIERKKRELRLLEEQEARMGNHTPPHVIMELEDLRREIGRWRASWLEESKLCSVLLWCCFANTIINV
jgi:hypothetical protein